MQPAEFAARLRAVRSAAPLVQCITNFVTVNDCANMILAAGGSPTMAHDLREVEESVAGVQALVLNLGAVGELEAMLLAGKTANALGIPVVLDPVAAGATTLRRHAAACWRSLALPSSAAMLPRSAPWPWGSGAAAGWTYPPGTPLPNKRCPKRQS